MVTFIGMCIGMCVVVVLIAVGVYASDYRYEIDEDGNERVVDENE